MIEYRTSCCKKQKGMKRIVEVVKKRDMKRGQKYVGNKTKLKR